MTISQAIEESISQGWQYEGETPRCDELYDAFYIHDQDGGFVNLNLCKVILDPSFWQCLGKAIGWEGEDMYQSLTMSAYMAYWHRLIDHISEGGTIEKYFEELV
jgi:hypothetical protein